VASHFSAKTGQCNKRVEPGVIRNKMTKNTTKSIVLNIFNIALIIVVSIFLLKRVIPYIPFTIRKWLSEYAVELTQLWVLGFVFVCFSGAIYLVMEARSGKKSSKFWCVLLSVLTCLIYTILLTYMSIMVHQNTTRSFKLPFQFPKGIETVEDVTQNEEFPADFRAKFSVIYAKYIYLHEGKFVGVHDEDGSIFEFTPSIEQVKEREQWLTILAQGKKYSSMLIDRTIYYFSALFIGLFVGYWLTRDRITSG